MRVICSDICVSYLHCTATTCTICMRMWPILGVSCGGGSSSGRLSSRWYERREISDRRNVDRSARRPFCEEAWATIPRYRHHYHIIIAVVAEPLFISRLHFKDLINLKAPRNHNWRTLFRVGMKVAAIVLWTFFSQSQIQFNLLKDVRYVTDWLIAFAEKRKFECVQLKRFFWSSLASSFVWCHFICVFNKSNMQLTQNGKKKTAIQGANVVDDDFFF